jgi:hypothetical protein
MNTVRYLRFEGVFAAVATSVFAGCLLTTSFDGLTDGGLDAATPDDAAIDAPPPEVGTDDARDAGPADTGADAAPDGSSASRVQLVQKQSLTYAAAATNTQMFPAPVSAGDALFAVMLTHNPDAGATYAVSDVLANGWKATPYHRCAMGNGGARIWYVESAKPGVDTVTVSQSTGTGELGLALFEYAGLQAVNALEAEASQCAPLASTTMSTPTITTTGADLVVGLFVDPCGSGTMAAGMGFSLVDLNAAYYYLFEDEENAGAGLPAGTYQATATNPQNSACWLGTIAGFKIR